MGYMEAAAVAETLARVLGRAASHADRQRRSGGQSA